MIKLGHWFPFLTLSMGLPFKFRTPTIIKENEKWSETETLSCVKSSENQVVDSFGFDFELLTNGANSVNEIRNLQGGVEENLLQI